MKKTTTKAILFMSASTFWTICISCIFATTLIAGHTSPAQNIQDVIIKVEYNDATLLEVFEDIENKTNFKFLYRKSAIKYNSKRINLKPRKASVAWILQNVSIQTGLGFQQTNSTIAVNYPDSPAPIDGDVQTGTITGTVTDVETGDPMPGANVMVESTNEGTFTDSEGKFEISDLEPGMYTIRVSYIGYDPVNKEVSVKDGQTTTVTFALQQQRSELDEMVVTGYGEVERRKLTGAITQVSSESLEDVPLTSVDEVLQGSVPGLQLSTTSGTPGSYQSTYIRGISSINAGTAPLYVIDGVPVISGGLQQSGSTSNLGMLATLSPSSIKSISVLKDAVATSRYGARGSNGVIVITTKEGRKGDTEYSFSFQRGSQERVNNGPPMLNAQQWDELYIESLINAGVDPSNAQSPWDGTTNTDWKDVTSRDNAAIQEFSLSANGGTDQITFFASANYQTQEGANIGVDFERIGGRLNVGYDLSETARLENKLSGSRIEQNGLLEFGNWFASPVTASVRMLPIDPVYNEDGTLNLNPNSPLYNPVYIAEHDITFKKTHRILNNTTFTLNLMDNLSFQSRLGLDYLTTEEKYYDNPVHGDGAGSNGRVYPYYSRRLDYDWQNSLEYNWQVHQDHIVDIQLLQEAQKNTYQNIVGGADNFSTMGLTDANSAANPTYVSSVRNEWSVFSFMGTAGYGYKDKIFVDATYRYEGSSKFAPGRRWGGYYSIGASWLLSEELFLQGTENWLDLLKLRLSYGKTGNEDIGTNEYQAFLGYGGAYSGQGAIAPSQLGNRDVTWEKATSIDIGLNVGLFDRFTAEATFFRKTSTDLLFNVPLSYTTGHTSQLQNIGELYNQGFELSLDVEVLQRQDIKWSLGANFTKIKNEVTKLPQDANGNELTITNSVKYIAVEGYANDAWFMKSWAGVDPENGQPLWYKDVTDAEGNVTGQTTTSDYNEATDYYQGASPMPTKFGSINTNLTIKGFFLNASLYYSFGNKVWVDNEYGLASDGEYIGTWNQYASQYEDRWQAPGDQAEVPQVISGGNMQSNNISSRRLYDGDYLRLRTLRLGYNIPASLLSDLNIGLSSVSIYFVGRNLWTYTYDEDLGWDPEVPQGSGFIDMQASPMKTMTVGIKANF